MRATSWMPVLSIMQSWYSLMQNVYSTIKMQSTYDSKDLSCQPNLIQVERCDNRSLCSYDEIEMLKNGQLKGLIACFRFLWDYANKKKRLQEMAYKNIVRKTWADDRMR